MVNDSHSNDERWQELALRIQGEKDPRKVVELAQELIATLDETRRRKPETEHFQDGGSLQRQRDRSA